MTVLDTFCAYLKMAPDARPDASPLDIAPDALVDVGGESLQGERLTEFFDEGIPSEVKVVASRSTDDGFFVLFDFVDEVTGLTFRQSWNAQLSPKNRVHRLYVLSALVWDDGPRDQYRRTVDWELALFGLSAIDVERDSELVHRVDSALHSLGFGELEYNRHALLVNEELIYVPLTCIGCCGFLVRRADFKVAQLGSGQRVGAHLWAYYKGCAMPFEGEGCSTLIIHSVSNERAVERILRLCIDGRHYLHEVQPLLRRLPARIEQLDLGFIHEELWKCEMRGWMRFEVERS